MNFFHLGIKDDITPYMKGKVKLSNQVSIMCAFIGFFYAFFIYAHYEALVIYPAMLFVISISLLALNHFGMVQTSRFLASFQMLIMASLFHASIIQSSDSFLIPFFCSMLAMTLIPWVLYGMEEKVMLIISLTICYGLLLSQGYLNQILEIPVDVAFFRESYLNIMTYAFAIAIAVVLLIMMKLDDSERYKLKEVE
ncbi:MULTISPECIES: hypothetical protein [Reichenbachiella]|uniref:Uncharacterized protein n=1 Tax=Reichenbachiella agariperforans TaxID=156994 RepID=A0A1M6J9H4_REIAG|nr:MULTISPECIES: hypothetical protein [Reichenbachiella]RJE74888.1 hypothetical protein BGP76_17335 [Reichenbachiella sp. MSK19-1]SHJ43262.1 hypothetical protein SAMN04488028_10195 [Reichenbachiella agariperforans]